MESKTLSIKSRPRLAILQLVIFAGLSTLIYLILVVRPANLINLYEYPRQDLHYLWDHGAPARWRLTVAFLLLGLVYWLSYRVARQIRHRSAWFVVAGGGLIFAGVMSLLQPIDAADIYDNIMHGRIMGVYGANPFQQVAADYPDDPFFPYVAWKRAPSAYGPGWEAMAGLTANLAGNGILANVFAFKLLAGIFWLGCSVVVAIAMQNKKPQYTLSGFLLFTWNPVVIYEVWGNGHNDMALVFWVLIAYLAILRGRHSLGVLSLVMGAVFKFIPILLIPPVLIIALRGEPTSLSRVKFLFKTALCALLIIALAYGPFWEGVDVLSITRRTQLFSASLPASVYHVLMLWFDADTAARVVSVGALILTSLLVLWRSTNMRIANPTYLSSIPKRSKITFGWSRNDHSGDDFIQVSFDIMAFYLLFTCLWFQGWYSLWLIGLSPLMGTGYRSRLSVLLGFAGLGKQFIVSPLLFWPRPSLAQPWLEIFYSLGVLGLPWSYTLYALWDARDLVKRNIHSWLPVHWFGRTKAS